MKKVLKRNTGRKIEQLHHFRCASCKKWWSVGDAPAKKTNWWCAWCGHRDTFENDTKKK